MSRKSALIRCSAAALALGLALPATAASATSASPATRPHVTELSALRTLNVVGQPMKVSLPDTWPALSPKAIYDSKTTAYPASVKYLARLDDSTPAEWLSGQRSTGLMAYLPNRGMPPRIMFSDQGTSLTFTALKAAVTSDKSIQLMTTSQVKTPFGYAYRLHLHTTDRTEPQPYALLALMTVGTHKIMVASVSASSAQAKWINDVAVTTAAKR